MKSQRNETPEQRKVLFFHFFSLIIVNIIFLISRFGFIFREDSKWNVRWISFVSFFFIFYFFLYLALTFRKIRNGTITEFHSRCGVSFSFFSFLFIFFIYKITLNKFFLFYLLFRFGFIFQEDSKWNDHGFLFASFLIFFFCL